MEKPLLIILLFCICSISDGQEPDTITYKPVEYPEGFTSQLNVVYTKVKDWEGKMDIYLPPKESEPTPVVINIHGGGWNKGVKESVRTFDTTLIACKPLVVAG
jgi:acetyl esterase/lipase